MILAANPRDTSRLDLPQEVREIQAVKRQYLVKDAICSNETKPFSSKSISR
ncbi:MAG: hypothetical protein MJK14_08700 [Rivularia sp. ALOHA_DT_140]|nr:hypothetical protein [Rivularia sp. ALOHA_DT_140]